MARIFLSHSSRDNPQAVALRDWLTAEGWQDLFLDLDPSRGIAAGERWERRLHEAAHRCEAVLFLVSRAWLGSEWCLREFRLAQKLNKRSFGILIEPIPMRDLPAELTASWQFVDLAQGADHRIFRAALPDGTETHITFSTSGLKRLKAGLTRAGLDARFFQWPPEDDPDRPPFRGMRPLEAGDAGIFFGREAPTIEGLDRLRGLSEGAAPRFMVILGASGAGKSSFLRAGLLPRLARDDRKFLPLPILRPERAAISGETGLIRSLETASAAAGLTKSRAALKAAVEDGAPAVAALLAALAEKVRAPAGTNEGRPEPPRIVLAIDQAEELFLAEGAVEADVFLRLVRDLAADPASNLIVVATIRSDAYERLQTSSALEGVRHEALSLPPMPRGAYQTVIEAPAARLVETKRPLKIEPALTSALLRDVEDGDAKDALSLLAFTLERLYLEYGGDGDLTLAEYEHLGRIGGSIKAAVEGALQAADGDSAVPRDRAARESLLRRALIPWLASIDPETGSPRRRVALFSEIPQEAQPLIRHLVEARLLATDQIRDTGETTVEPAHESLLRQWALLQGWLADDFVALSTLEGIRRATRDWESSGRSPDWLAHTAGRLEDGEGLLLRRGFAASLDASERAYLAEARAVDDAQRNRELYEARRLAEAQGESAMRQRQVARRTLIGLVVAGVLAAVAVGAALYGFDQAARADMAANRAAEQAAIADAEKNRAEEQARAAESERNLALVAQSRMLAEKANRALADGDAATAMLLAMEGLPSEHVTKPYVAQAEEALSAALSSLREKSIFSGEGGVAQAVFSPDGTQIAAASQGAGVHVWETETRQSFSLEADVTATISSIAYRPDGKQIVGGSREGDLWIWDTAGAALKTIHVPGTEITRVAYSPDGRRIVVASSSRDGRVVDPNTGLVVLRLVGHTGSLTSVAFSPDGALIATGSVDGSARLWDAHTGNTLVTIDDHDGSVNDVAFSRDGALVFTASEDGSLRGWNSTTGEQLGLFTGAGEPLRGVAVSRDYRHIATGAAGGTTYVLDGVQGSLAFKLAAGAGATNSVDFSPDGRLVLTTSADGTTRIWSAADNISAPWMIAGPPSPIRSAMFSPNGLRIVTAADDATARVWDAITGAELFMLSGHTKGVSSAVFSSDGSRIVTSSQDLTARVWNATTGEEMAVLRGNTAPLLSAAFGPDGASILTASSDGALRTWDASLGRQSLAFHEAGVSFGTAVFSPDGSIAVTASEGSAILWDVGTGERVRSLKCECDGRRAAFSSDGARFILSAGSKANVFDTETGAVLAALGEHAGPVNAVGFSPNGLYAVTASSFDGVRIWESATGYQTRFIGATDLSATSVSFSGDGKRIIVASQNGTISTWRLSTSIGELVSESQRDLPRCLSPKERAAYFLTAGVPVWCFEMGKWPYDHSPDSGTEIVRQSHN